MIELYASILAGNHVHIARDIKKAESLGISRFHIDVVDGHYVNCLIFGNQMVSDLKAETSAELYMHLTTYNQFNMHLFKCCA